MNPITKTRVRIIAVLLLVQALALSGCASALKTVNGARDLYNTASTKAVAAHELGVITDAHWDSQVQPTLKQFHDAVDRAYIAMKQGIELDFTQLLQGQDPQNPTLYDIVKRYSQGDYK